MDKQKQIEEMVGHITIKCESCVCGCEDCEFCTESKAYCRSRCHAAELYNAGYRKIPEGSVVLTREEYEVLTNDLDKCDYGDFENGYSQGYTQGSKETAEKFAERLKELYSVYGEYDELYIKTIRLDIDEICKEITEEKV